MAPTALAWIGDGAPRMEVAHVERGAGGFTAAGTQLGEIYELRYRLDGKFLALDVIGERSVELELVDADFFDVGFSPLFNSLPVIRDGLLEAGCPSDYVMSWVDVPSLEVSRSEQRYEPLGNGLVRFSAGDFTADIEFDDAGFVVRYPGIATRAPGGRPG
jgi:uncharacterized protein